MAAVRKVDVAAYAEQVLRLFDENARRTEHPRAVIAEGEADLWLAEDKGRLVGVLLGRPMRSADGERRGGVDNLLVDARHRRRGIGRRLMEAAEAHYRDQNLYGMQLVVNAENVTARRLHDSMGYRVVERYVRRRNGPAGEEIVEPRLRMWKRFDAS